MKVLTIGDLHFSTNNVIEMDIISDKILEKVKEMYKITKRLELNKDLKSGKKKVKIEGNKFHILSV